MQDASDSTCASFFSCPTTEPVCIPYLSIVRATYFRVGKMKLSEAMGRATELFCRYKVRCNSTVSSHIVEKIILFFFFNDGIVV